MAVQRGSRLPRRMWRVIPDEAVPIVKLRLLPITTPYGMPNPTLSSGVMRKPPPTPNRPVSTPTSSPKAASAPSRAGPWR